MADSVQAFAEKGKNGGEGEKMQRGREEKAGEESLWIRM